MLAQPLRPTAQPAALRLALALALVVCSLAAALPGLVGRPAAGGPAPLAAAPRLPLQFAPEPGGAWSAQGPAGAIAFRPGALRLALPAGAGTAPATLEVRFLGGAGALAGRGAPAGMLNAYAGAEPAGWREGVVTYAGLTYRGLYPGVDLAYDGADGALKGTYFVAPGADPAQIRWRYAGASGVRIDPASGDLLIAMPDGRELREHAPVAWQEGAGRTPVAARFTLAAGGALGFALGAYDPARELVIDPTLAYGTYLGGSSDDEARGLAVAPDGSVVVVGRTYSAQFPSSSGAGGQTNVFVTRLNPAGDGLIYSTVLAGGDDDEGLAVAVDAQGNAWVTGLTESGDFPRRGGAGGGFAGGVHDTFAARLSPSGALLTSVLIGDDGNDKGSAIALDRAGNVFIAGESTARFGPVATIRKFGPDGAQLAGGYFGAASRGFLKGSAALGLALDAEGLVYLVGETNTYDFPEFRPLFPGCQDDGAGDCADRQGFLSVIDLEQNELVMSTYIGGSDGDSVRAVALDASGGIYLTGQSYSADLPLAGPHAEPKRGPENFSDAFVMKLAPRGASLAYATFFGGEAWDEASAIAVDAGRNVYIAGLTSSSDMPLAGQPAQSEIRGICISGSNERYCYDGFVAALDAAGALSWSSFLGGTYDDQISALGLDGRGGVYVAGRAESLNFPTTAGAAQPAKAMADDAFVVKIGPGGSGAPTPTPTPPAPTPQPSLTNRLYLPLLSR